MHECGRFSTATYCVVLDHHGEMYCAVGDMNINESISVDWVRGSSAVTVAQRNSDTATAKFVCTVHNYNEECLDMRCKQGEVTILKLRFRHNKNSTATCGQCCMCFTQE